MSFALPSMICMAPSAQEGTQRPQPSHFSSSILTTCLLGIGISLSLSIIILKTNPTNIKNNTTNIIIDNCNNII